MADEVFAEGGRQTPEPTNGLSPDEQREDLTGVLLRTIQIAEGLEHEREMRAVDSDNGIVLTVGLETTREG